MLYLITRPAFDAVVRQPIKQSGIADKALTNLSISFERTGSRMDIEQKRKLGKGGALLFLPSYFPLHSEQCLFSLPPSNQTFKP